MSVRKQNDGVNIENEILVLYVVEALIHVLKRAAVTSRLEALKLSSQVSNKASTSAVGRRERGLMVSCDIMNSMAILATYIGEAEEEP